MPLEVIRGLWSRFMTRSRPRRFVSLLSGLESGAATAKSGIPEGHPGPPPAVSVSSEDLRVVRGPSRKRVDRCDLRNPHLPEVDGRVAGLPSLQKPLDWRVKRNRVQLVNVKCAMTTDGGGSVKPKGRMGLIAYWCAGKLGDLQFQIKTSSVGWVMQVNSRPFPPTIQVA